MPNKEFVKNSFTRSHATYHDAAVIQSEMAQKLADELASVRVEYSRVLELGVGTGLLTQALSEKLKINALFCNDLMDASHLIQSTGQFIVGDAEQVDYPKHLDLITSNAVVQWFDDLPKFFQKSAQHLTKGGLLAFTTFGPNNFKELRKVTEQGLDYYNLVELKELLQPDYELIFCHESEVALSFSTVKSLLKHLKETGVNGLNGKSLTKSRYRQLLQDYPTENGSFNLTYHPITIVAQKVS